MGSAGSLCGLPFFVYAEPAYLIYLMAFVRKKVKTFKWPVEVEEPSATKPGKFEKSEFTAIFKRVKMSELEGVTDAESASLLKKVLVGWEGIKDEDGDEIEFSEAELDDFAEDVDWLKAVLAAYTKTYGEAQAGN